MHTFNQAGTYSYYCSVHCGFGMTGTVQVAAAFITLISVSHGTDGHFIIDGQTLPNLTINVETSPDLVTAFANAVPVTATNTGTFHYDDSSAGGLTKKFYRATYP
jgi:heme/copper-type cytochrome/quinol oxidase subunit 2